MEQSINNNSEGEELRESKEEEKEDDEKVEDFEDRGADVNELERDDAIEKERSEGEGEDTSLAKNSSCDTFRAKDCNNGHLSDNSCVAIESRKSEGVISDKENICSGFGGRTLVTEQKDDHAKSSEDFELVSNGGLVVDKTEALLNPDLPAQQTSGNNNDVSWYNIMIIISRVSCSILHPIRTPSIHPNPIQSNPLIAYDAISVSDSVIFF